MKINEMIDLLEARARLNRESAKSKDDFQEYEIGRAIGKAEGMEYAATLLRDERDAENARQAAKYNKGKSD